MKDYSHLEGKVVDVKGFASATKGFIVGVDYDIGITMVNADDHEDYLWCLLGPTGFRIIKGHNHPNKGSYKRKFETGVKMIEKGIVDSAKLVAAFNPFLSPSSATCAFAQ